MNNEMFSRVVDELRKVSLETLRDKNANYAKGSEDALHNFKVGAAMCNGTPAQAAWGYMVKHLVALHDKVENNDFHDASDLLEKCQDIINYVAIIYAIGIEERSKYCTAGSGGQGCVSRADVRGHTLKDCFDPLQLTIPGYNNTKE